MNTKVLSLELHAPSNAFPLPKHGRTLRDEWKHYTATPFPKVQAFSLRRIGSIHTMIGLFRWLNCVFRILYCFPSSSGILSARLCSSPTFSFMPRHLQFGVIFICNFCLTSIHIFSHTRIKLYVLDIFSEPWANIFQHHISVFTFQLFKCSVITFLPQFFYWIIKQKNNF